MAGQQIIKNQIGVCNFNLRTSCHPTCRLQESAPRLINNPVRQNGRGWVRFIVPGSKKNKSVELRFELPVASKSRIKQHHISELDERYIVKLDFCMNGQVYTADFSLDNREKFNYSVLLGRQFLKQHFIVDPAQTFTKKYHCQ